MAYQDDSIQSRLGGRREPTLGGSLYGATEAPSDETLIELGLAALRSAYDIGSDRSRSVAGTRPAPTGEETSRMEALRQRGQRQGPRPQGPQRGGAQTAGPQMGGPVGNLMRGGGGNQFGLSGLVDRARQGQGRGHRGGRPGGGQRFQPFQQMQRGGQPGGQPGGQQMAMGFNPMMGMQPFDPNAALRQMWG